MMGIFRTAKAYLRRHVILMQTRIRGVGKGSSEVFDHIYKNNIWSPDRNSPVSSGVGSESKNSKVYEDCICDYIQTHNIKSILDIGCGDFQVSKRILERLDPDVRYFGGDISRVIIERNKSLFKNPLWTFMKLDAAAEELPKAELVLVREVLQHLNNAEVLKILVKASGYDHALITNTVAREPVEINMDIPTGAPSRAHVDSGLWIDQPPFNFPVEEILRIKHKNAAADIITCRILN